jgi:ABC-type transporter Mla subunit MlaD
LAALYDQVEAVLDELNQVADAAAAGDPAAIERLTSEDPSHGSLQVAAMAFDEVNRRAIEYGLTVCGE